MLDLFVKQKQALGYDYVGGYNALHVFDTFSKRTMIVKNYELSKEIVLAWAQKRPNENDTTRSARIMYLQHFATIFKQPRLLWLYCSPTAKISFFTTYGICIHQSTRFRKLFISLDQMDYTHQILHTAISAFPLYYTGCFMDAVSAYRNFLNLDSWRC